MGERVQETSKGEDNDGGREEEPHGGLPISWSVRPHRSGVSADRPIEVVTDAVSQ
jgi:hypothetical protein